ncbi:hypothetical protein FB567DRAFT_552855 [Paraphoma chrysanthemicola]|uniref:Uncharacterized protein n=1 Tax=Paraphoma chrysanthemicola TaxID=798071 RepID=A0A8K0QY65_9PLEO|nr:hypothetical protein FB567DRAFT_552855 [Paraphoma chrysanthemicola]
MDNVTYDPEHLTLTKTAKGLLDLPGEVRNKIYHYHLINWISDDHSTAFTAKWENRDHHDVVDMQWLLIFLIDFPNISVAFNGNDEFNQEGYDLEKLIDIARSTPGWRNHAAGFHSIKLVAKFWYRSWEDSSRLELSLDIVKHDVGQQWRDKHELFPRHIEELKADLGLTLDIPSRWDIPARWSSSPFLRLRTEVYKHSTYLADAHGCLDPDGLWKASWKQARP